MRIFGPINDIYEYVQNVNAIQWDGTEETLNKLSLLFANDHKFWITDGDSSEVKRALRVNKSKRQGDYYVLVGDYLVISDDTVFHYSKKYFEQTFKPASE